MNVILRMEDCRFPQGKTADSEEEQNRLVEFPYDDKRLHEDLKTFLTALCNLEYEGLGSSVSRGYGRVKIELERVSVINRWGGKADVPGVKGAVRDLVNPKGQLTEAWQELSVPPRKDPSEGTKTATSPDAQL